MKVIEQTLQVKSILHTPFGTLGMLDLMPRFKHGIDLYTFYVVDKDGYATHIHLPVSSWMVVEIPMYETKVVKFILEEDQEVDGQNP